MTDCFVCATCGTQFPPSAEPPDGCPICLDERQYVGHGGQRWTTLAELGPDYRSEVRELEPGLVGIGTEPGFAIGQRALHVESGVLWDCVTAAGRDGRGGGRARRAGSTRSRSRIRTTTRRWSSGPTASTRASSCTRPTASG